MANNTSAPLLSQTEDKDTSSHFSFDRILEHSLSDFGLSQILQIILVGLPSTFDSQQIFITVFTDAYPTWHCMDHTMCNPATSDICGIPRSAWDWDDGFKGKSVISEFGLECSSSFLRGLPTSTFNVGAIFGGVFMAMIPDGFLGRKQLLFFTTLAMSITGISIYFSSNIWIYAFLKFVASCRCLESHIFSDTLLGQLSISARLFPRLAVYCIFLYLFAVESPRWLHLQGKDEEAIEMLKKISPANKGYLESVSIWLTSKETIEQAQRYSLKDLFIRKWAFRRTLVVMIIMLGSGLSYYGVPLAVRDIKVNIYLSEALNAVVELPTFVITPILLEKFSRRSSVVVNCLIGGASGMLCFVLSLLGMTNTAFALELACFFCGRIQFNLMAVYMVELFPTCVRNTATLMLRQALVVAGACSPIIASIGRDVPSLSFALFGLAMAGLGLFALLLPETKGSSLCDTMEAQEERDRVFNTSQSFLK
uniref:Major facilitator superfamily (MFS) profile domain-containing protein n=1 Tax=Brassica campestris TaxID=3711 RepID=M4FHQ1_BRACM